MRECITSLQDLGFRHGNTGDEPEVLGKVLATVEQRFGVGFDFELLKYETQVLRTVGMLMKGRLRIYSREPRGGARRLLGVLGLMRILQRLF